VQRGGIGFPRRQDRANGRIHASAQKHHGPWFFAGQIQLSFAMKCVTVLMAHPPRRAAPFRSLYFSIIAKLQGFGGVAKSGHRTIGSSGHPNLSTFSQMAR
jgi:hypothetical protein